MRSRNDDTDHDANPNPTRQNDTRAARDGATNERATLGTSPRRGARHQCKAFFFRP